MGDGEYDFVIQTFGDKRRVLRCSAEAVVVHQACPRCIAVASGAVVASPVAGQALVADALRGVL